MRKNTSEKYFIYNDIKNDEFTSFYNKVLKVDYNSLFNSEGYYNTDTILKHGKTLFNSSNVDQFNQYLGNNKGVSSNNIFLLLKFTPPIGDKVTLFIKSDNKITTELSFKPCVKFYCLIDLSKLPAFYEIHKFSSIYGSQDIDRIILMKYNENGTEIW